MAEKTGSNHSWQPMLGAAEARRSLLGSLLRLRRAALGYRYVPAFVKDRDINSRMVGDIEHARRDTFTFPTLEDVAAAYEVTYTSMMAVVWTRADELVSAAPAARPDAPPVLAAAPDRLTDSPDGWLPPIADRARRDATAPYAAPILERLLELADGGIIDPSGAQVFGEGTADARAWDGFGARLPVRDRAWFIAEVRRWEAENAGSAGNSGTGVTGA